MSNVIDQDVIESHWDMSTNPPTLKPGLSLLLSQLGDFSGSPTDGQALIWSQSAGKWQPGAASGLPADWFVVTKYGAKGDGVTDDFAAINLAIAALNSNGGGRLYFPQTGNSYHIATRSTGLTPITKNATIFGPRGVQIDCPAGLTAGPDFMTLGDNCELEDLLFTVNNSGGSIVKLNGAQNVVNDVIFGVATVQTGILVVGTENLLHDNMFVGQNATQSIQLNNGSYRSIVHDNLFEACNGSTGPLVLVKAGNLEFTINSNIAANCASTHAVIVEAGASDLYYVAGNNFVGLDVSDGGTGVTKLVNDNPVRV